MTIHTIEDKGWFYCEWFDKEEKFKFKTFSPDVLIKTE